MRPVLFALASMGLAAQPNVSIHPTNGQEPWRYVMKGDEMFFTGAGSLHRIVAYAFDVPEWRIVAPDWFKQARYRVAVTPPMNARVPLREALTETFSLVVHREERLVDSWHLRRTDSTLGRLRPAAEAKPHGFRASVGNTYAQVVCQPCWLENLASGLSPLLQAEVIDETGIAGPFEFRVMWTKDDPASLSRAWMEETGLDVVREPSPAELLIVDTATRPDPPTPPPAHACEASETIRAAIDRLPPLDDWWLPYAKRIGPRRALARQYPHDVFAQMPWQDAILRAPHLSAEYEAALASYRKLDDPVLSRYLEARLRLPFQKERSERLLAGLADYPWAHLASVEWAERYAPSDVARARRHLEAFRRLCPESIAALRYQRLLAGPDALAELSRAMDFVLPGRLDRETIAAWPYAWELLLRTREEPPARARIRAEVLRLRFLSRFGDREWVNTLLRGYRLSNDDAAPRLLDAAIFRYAGATALAFSLARERWHAEHTKAAPAAWLETIGKWEETWDGLPLLDLERWAAVRALPEAPAETVAAAADALLGAIEDYPDLAYVVPPLPIQIAEMYARCHIRRERIGPLVQLGLSLIDRFESLRLQSDVPAERAAGEANVAATYANARSIFR